MLIITRVHVTQVAKGVYSLNILTMPNNASWTLTRTMDDLVSFSQRVSRMAKGEGIQGLEPLKPTSLWWGKPSVKKNQVYFDALFGADLYPRWLLSSEMVWEFLMPDASQLPNLPMPASQSVVRVRIGNDTLKVNCTGVEDLKTVIKEKVSISVNKLFYVDAEGDAIVIKEEDELQAAILHSAHSVIQAE